MAKSTQEYFDELITIKEADSNLDLLTSDSNVAIWRLILWIQAICLSKFHELLDLFQKDVAEQSNQVYFATAAWWQEKMFAFQYGDQVQRITIDGKQYIKYAVVDESKQIITRCAVITKPKGGLLIKLATDAGKLTESQINAVASYVKAIQPEGIAIELLTREADILQLYYDLVYDPIFTKPVVEANVDAAVMKYLENLKYNGEFDLRKLEDEIQEYEDQGVVSFVCKLAKAKPEGGTFISFNRAYKSVSGYLEIDPSFDLTAGINFIPSTSDDL